MSQTPALDVLLQRYGQYLQLRNFSDRTIEDSVYNLRHMERFLESRNIQDIQSVTATVLMEFQNWLFYQPTLLGNARGVANQNRILSKVKMFFKFLKLEGYLAGNPAQDLEYAREPRSLPRNVLTPREAKKIIESVDVSTTLGYRDRTILEIFYATGIRSAELLNLRLEDINLEEEVLRINQGKGKYDRIVPLSSVACHYLETYIKGVRSELLRGKQTDLLFASWRGNALDRNNLGILVRKYARLAGIKKRVSCHVWRHTCATHLLKNNANLRHVQAILGHRSLATTEIYLHLTITDIKEAHRKFHPREKGVEHDR